MATPEKTVDELFAEANAILARIDKGLEEAKLLDAHFDDPSAPSYTYVNGVLVDLASPEYAAWYDRVYGGDYDWYDTA